MKDQQYEYSIQPSSKEIPAAAVVAKDRIVELTAKLDREGKLTWDVPEGDWTILRIGHTPTGAERSVSRGRSRAGMRQIEP